MADNQPMPIAIVGMSCRLPGDVSNPGQFYRMLCRKRSGWSQVPKDRFNAEAYRHPNPDKKGCMNSQGGYFIKDDISMFDAAFFDITKKEAECMDPAQRLLLECAYEALENAGYPREAVSGKNVGVFVGGNYGEHRVGNLRDLDHIPSFDATGNQGAFLAGRLAYYFNLKGPAFTVDTACSSSMHALHLAVQSIRAGESEQAIVGASHLITHPDIWVSMSKLRLFSDAGKTFAFDDRAKSGYARGEGAGCLILKPLDKAQADNDHIFSVITHTGINHNGRTVGIVAPSPEEQEGLLKKVFSEANISPHDVGFFEAHGTGTKKGDPIEATAIHKAVGKHFTEKDPLYMGSVKPNVGHLECASGIVSVIKSVLMLYYGFVLPNADFQQPNEAIPFKSWGLKVATDQKPWPPKRKYVCVNNFGFSGSNSTCILRAAPQTRGLEMAENGAYSPLRLFILSANDEPALRNSIKRLGIWIEQHAELYQTTMPRNLAYTLCQRRSHLPWRVAVVAGMCSGVASALNSHDAVLARAPTEPPRLAFVYTGQGAQWFAMGRELLRTHPVFADAIRRADDVLRDIGADFSVFKELLRDKAATRVGQAHISQPICSAVQLALTDLFAAFGVRPAAVTGHSSGEIAAAYAAGALTFESAVAAAYYRGQVILELKRDHAELKGAMMAVGAGAADLTSILDRASTATSRVVVACENSPSSTTLSGDEEAVDRVAVMFNEEGVFNRKLFVDVAYHSPHMKFLAKSYFKRVSHIEAPVDMENSQVEFYSSLYGRKVSLNELGPQYWVDNLTRAVRFSTSLKKLCTEVNPEILVEIGPHAALKGPIMQTIKTLGPAAMKISYLPTLIRGEDATRTCLDTAGQLFVHGYPLNFFEVNHRREEDEKPEVIPSLYTYPWSRQKYWYESRLSQQHRLKPFERNDLLGTIADWSSALEPTWRNIIRTEDLPWLKEYRVHSRMVFPTAGFLSMVIEAAGQLASLNGLEPPRFDIKNFAVSEHLFLEDDQEFEVLLNLRPFKRSRAVRQSYGISITSYEAGRGWKRHCTGTVMAVCQSPDAPPNGGQSDDDQGWFSGSLTNEYMTAQCRLQDTKSTMPMEYETSYKVHPVVLDSMIQAGIISREALRGGHPTTSIPRFIRHLTVQPQFSKLMGNRFASSVVIEPKTSSVIVELFSRVGDSGTEVTNSPLITLSGLKFQTIAPAPSTPVEPRELCYKMDWIDLPKAIPQTLEDKYEKAGVMIVLGHKDDAKNSPLSQLSAKIREETGGSAGICTIDQAVSWKDVFVIVWEVERPLLWPINETRMEQVKNLLTQCRGVMWVTRGGNFNPTTPNSNLALGMIRTARSERNAIASTLDLSSGSELTNTEKAQLVRDAFVVSILSSNTDGEMEFAEDSGRLMVPRIHRDSSMNTEVHRALGLSTDHQATHELPGSIFDRRGTHIIVGGTGGLGLSIARYMLDHGATTILLLSRSGRTDDNKELLDLQHRALKGAGARVIAMKCDVTDEMELKKIFEECQRTLPHICGIIHAAMVLRDGLIEDMSHDDYQAVIRPKVRGATNIHNVLIQSKANVAYFVALSSAAGILGSRGQAAYAAANTFLDSLMQFRASKGLPGVSLDLTAVTGAGYLAENAERQKEILRNFGHETIDEKEALALIGVAVCGTGNPQCLTGMKLHLEKDGEWPYYASDARFLDLKAECLAEAEREGVVPKQAIPTGTAFRSATSDEEAIGIAAQGIVEKLSEVLTISVGDLDVARNITSYGLDSLTAIELRNWIAKELRANLQILELLSSGTISDLAALIVQKTRTA